MTRQAYMPKRMLIGAFMACTIMLLPLIAMQVTDEVNWTAFDFVAGTALLAPTGAIIGGATALNRSIAVRGAIILATLVAFLAIWAQMI